MKHSLTITQAKTLRLVRKPLPPRGSIILDAKTKARRKRVKRVSEPYLTPSQFNVL